MEREQRTERMWQRFCRLMEQQGLRAPGQLDRFESDTQRRHIMASARAARTARRLVVFIGAGGVRPRDQRIQPSAQPRRRRPRRQGHPRKSATCSSVSKTDMNSGIRPTTQFLLGDDHYVQWKRKPKS